MCSSDLIDKGADGDNVDYGARPLRRSVERYIEDPLSEELLRGVFEGKNHIFVEVKEVADKKQLDFTGSAVEEPELAAVGTEAGEGEAESKDED